MSEPRSNDSQGIEDRRLTVELEGFAWDLLDAEAARDELTVEEIVTFSVLYYLADVDSGRISRRISRSPYSAGSTLAPRHRGETGR